MTKKNALWDKQQELSQKLTSLPTDKDKIKLLLRTMSENNRLDDSTESLGLIAFAIGYLGSLLVKHGLYDWED